MADTNHQQTPGHDSPVEGDGISYGGIGWFVVVLTVTTAICYALMWGMFRVMENRVDAADAARSALALPVGTLPPQPNMLVEIGVEGKPNYAPGEPEHLRDYRASEELRLITYGWVDQNAGTFRLPIEQAKDLLLERGLPVRER